MKPHLHADLIKLWADGSEIEILIPSGGEAGWEVVKNPSWREFEVYRVKPERQPNIVMWRRLWDHGAISNSYLEKPTTSPGTCRALLRIEIDHNDPANPVLVSATLEKP